MVAVRAVPQASTRLGSAVLVAAVERSQPLAPTRMLLPEVCTVQAVLMADPAPGSSRSAS